MSVQLHTYFIEKKLLISDLNGDRGMILKVRLDGALANLI